MPLPPHRRSCHHCNHRSMATAIAAPAFVLSLSSLSLSLSCRRVVVVLLLSSLSSPPSWLSSLSLSLPSWLLSWLLRSLLLSSQSPSWSSRHHCVVVVVVVGPWLGRP